MTCKLTMNIHGESLDLELPTVYGRLGCPGPDVLPMYSIIKHTTGGGVSDDKMNWLLFEKYISTAFNYASKFCHRIP